MAIRIHDSRLSVVAAIYVIEELPDGDDPGRMAELHSVSPERSVCMMRQIIDLDALGPCEGP